LKFQYFEHKVYQVGSDRNSKQNFSSWALKEESEDVAQSSVNGGGGTWQTDFVYYLQVKYGKVSVSFSENPSVVHDGVVQNLASQICCSWMEQDKEYWVKSSDCIGFTWQAMLKCLNCYTRSTSEDQGHTCLNLFSELSSSSTQNGAWNK
jgi:hypothetical protein